LKRAGAFAVRDPRVTEEDNNKFLDLLEAYFEQPEGIDDINTGHKPVDFLFNIIKLFFLWDPS